MNTLNFNACFKCKQLLHRTILHSNTSTKKKHACVVRIVKLLYTV